MVPTLPLSARFRLSPAFRGTLAALALVAAAGGCRQPSAEVAAEVPETLSEASGVRDGGAAGDVRYELRGEVGGDGSMAGECRGASCPGPDGGDPAGSCDNGLLPAGASVNARGLMLACAGFELEVAALGAGTVRLRYREDGASAEGGSVGNYAILSPLPTADWSHGLEAGVVRLCTAELIVEIEESDCRVRVSDSVGRVLLADGAGGGFGRVAREWREEQYEGVQVVRESPPEELFFGLGEKSGPLNKRGRSWFFWNSDTPGYPVDHDPLYQSIPFFIGLRSGVAYGLFTDNSWPLEVDLAATDPGRYRVIALRGALDQYLFAGPEMARVVERYTELTGRSPLPPRWTLGYHQSRWSYSPDSQVREICQQFRQRGIPADGIWLDIDYMDGFRSFTWSPQDFPDPSGLVAELAAIGFKTTAIIDPGLKSDPGWELYDQGVAGGHFLKGPDGQPFVGEVWPGAAVFPDFTRPATRAWWAGLVPRLTDHGVRGIWLDMNEPASFLAADHNTVPGWVVAHGEGTPVSMDGAHNIYALAEAAATFEGMAAAVPSRRPFLLTRAGFAGIQRYAAVWTGDAASTMESLEMTVAMLLGLGLSGVPFVGSDVGGWTGGPTPELFVRWLQVGSISPFFRSHVATGTPAQEPWAFGAEAEEVSRLAIQFRYRLLPYLYSLFREHGRTGLPPLRPLVMEFQGDEEAATVSTQALLGPWLMAAPVVSAGVSERTLYLPAGRWLEWHSGALWQGPGTISVDLKLQALPLFLREGAIVPLGPVMEWSDAQPLSPLHLELFAGPGESSFLLYEDDGESLDYLDGLYSETLFRLAPSDDGAVLTAAPREGSWQPPERQLTLRLRRVDSAPQGVFLDGEPLAAAASPGELDQMVSGYCHDANDLALLVRFPDRAPFELSFHYDPEVVDPDPPVKVPLVVQLPSGTPSAGPVHVATSASGWQQQPLSWVVPGLVAGGEVEVPRGRWFEYKYTRGDWATVEKWHGCLEATNRYAQGKAHPVKEDTVEGWADWCQ